MQQLKGGVGSANPWHTAELAVGDPRDPLGFDKPSTYQLIYAVNIG